MSETLTVCGRGSMQDIINGCIVQQYEENYELTVDGRTFYRGAVYVYNGNYHIVGVSLQSTFTRIANRNQITQTYSYTGTYNYYITYVDSNLKLPNVWNDPYRSAEFQTIPQLPIFTNLNDLLAYVTTPAPPLYTWQSVPSISGKNGILSLVTLDSESVNDGEPVSGAAVSVFDQAPSNDNNIKNLADTYGGGEASSAVDVTVKYKVTLPPGGIFDVLKLVAKKGSEPEDVTDGDKIVNISANKTKKTVTGLDENSMYYFKIFAEDSNGSTSESDEKHITTSGDEGWSFDYTGQIQTFTAPKTGIYSLETWGAQGGDATDGTNTARGGYGAYAYGEVLLQQGETIYINIGGQNGYGGGGNYVPPFNPQEYYDKINGSGFDFIRQFENIVITGSTKAYTSDTDTVTWYAFRDYGTENEDWTTDDLSSSNGQAMVKVSYNNTIDDIYITSNGDEYSVTLNCNWFLDSYSDNFYFAYYHSPYNIARSSCGYYPTGGSRYFPGNCTLTQNYWYTKTITGTFEEVIKGLCHFVRNCNLYVDGVLVSSPQDSNS